MADADILAEIRRNEGLDSPEPEDGQDTVRIRDADENEVQQPSGKRGRRKQGRRITLTVVDGQVDLTRTHPSQLKQLTEAIAASPEAQAQLGTVTTATGKAEIPLSLCGALYDGVGALERLAAIHLAHYPAPVAFAAFQFTQEQKDNLAPPTQKVLQKYVPADWMAYSAETELALALYAVVMQQVQVSQELLKKWNETHPKKPNSGGVQQVLHTDNPTMQ